MARPARSGLRAAVGRADITPPAGLPMSGFLIRNGPSVALGIHDPLQVAALAIGNADSTVLILTFDLVGLTSDWVSRTRQAVEKACGIAPHAQMYCCSHTHCGPATGVLPYDAASNGDPVQQYMDWLIDRAVSAARQAVASMEPVELAIGSAFSLMGWNRRSAEASSSGPHDGHVDELDLALLVAQFTSPSGRTVATIVNYGCHATSSRDSYYSADYVGYARSVIESATGAPCFYINGAGADVNPRGRVADSSFEIAELRGAQLGNDTLAALSDLQPSASHSVRAAQKDATLVYTDLISETEARGILAEGTAALQATDDAGQRAMISQRQIDFADRVLAARADPSWASTLSVEVQAMRIGDLGIAAFPVEFFSADGRALRGAGLAPHLAVAGWTNGLWGYTPTRRAFAHGGYEPENAFRYYGHPAAWAPESGDNLRHAAAVAVRSLFRQEAV